MSLVPNRAIEGAAGNQGYNLQRSLRFRSSASAYLSRTPAANGNRQILTWSGWVKRGSLSDSAYMYLYGAYPGTSATDTINFINGTLRVWFNGSSSADLVTTQVFRDPSAWYHIVIAIDTTQATASNRIKVYVNGAQVTSFSTATYPAQNYSTLWNSTSYSNQLCANGNGPQSFFDGYLAEVNFIDGQALTPSSFGETDTETGVWKPKKYGGTYGTNGFYLDFKDNTSATTLAYDKSGNGNNWTPNNISTAAGSTYDSMLDVPTLTSATAANYSTWNPINNGLGGTVSNANLTLSGVSVVASRINSTIGVSSGKWYFETTLTTAGDYTTVGIGQGNITNQYPGNDALSYAQTLERATSINSNTQPAYGTALVGGDVFMCAFDLDNNKVFFGKNGTWFGTSNPETGANPAYTIAAGTYNAIARPNPSGFSTTAVLNTNFGQRPFSYTPPTGFKALNTYNLPDPTIKKPNQYMDATLYTGTNANLTVTNAGSFQPDLVWTKSRSNSDQNVLCDSVRGPTLRLISNLTIAEVSNGLTSINSNGFSLGDASTSQSMNNSGESYVGWQWKKGATPGFDIVTYTGTGSAQNINHSLGVAPKMMIVKSRSRSDVGWPVYHINDSATPTNGYMLLNGTGAFEADSAVWNNTAPTSSVFTVGSLAASNASGSTYVAYLFAEIAGFSKFGSYTGNGSADGPFVYCGFRPKYVMMKSTSVDIWIIYDSVRDTYNIETNYLIANSSAAEGQASVVDFLSNGFKLQTTGNPNKSTDSYIFMAFAENPFKYSLAR